MTSCHSPWVEDRWFLPLFCSRSIQHLFIFQPRDLPGCVCWNRRRSIPRRFSTPIWSFFSFSSLVFTWQRGTFVSHDVCRWRVSLPPIHRTCRRLFPSFVPTSNATGGRVVVFRCLLGVVASAHHNVDRSYDRPIAFRFIPTVGCRTSSSLSFETPGAQPTPHDRPIEISSMLAFIVRSTMRLCNLTYRPDLFFVQPRTPLLDSSAHDVLFRSLSSLHSVSFRGGVGR